MAVVKIEPTMDHPVPFSTDETKLDNFMEEVAVAAGTAELLEELGAPLEVDPSTLDREKALIDAVAKQQQAAPLTNYTTALAASAFLKTYGQNLAFDVGQVRAALTNKLLEIANCGDTKYELRALELLGKVMEREKKGLLWEHEFRQFLLKTIQHYRLAKPLAALKRELEQSGAMWPKEAFEAPKAAGFRAAIAETILKNKT